MPRLGTPLREAAAYATHPNRRTNPLTLGKTIAMVLVCTLVLRNLLFTDYRMQEIETLRASGKTQEEIDAIVPKKYSEMVEEKQNRAKTVEDMQKDIAFLLKEVKELRQISQVQGINENGNETIEKTSSTSTSRQLVENAKEVTTKTVTDAPWEKDIASLRHEVQELRQIIQGKSTRRQHFANNQKEETQTAPWDSDSGILGMHTGGSTSIVDAVLNE